MTASVAGVRSVPPTPHATTRWPVMSSHRPAAVGWTVLQEVDGVQPCAAGPSAQHGQGVHPGQHPRAHQLPDRAQLRPPLLAQDSQQASHARPTRAHHCSHSRCLLDDNDGAHARHLLLLAGRPTARDFTYIISFLFRQVDPHFKMVGKLEEEVIGFFKVRTVRTHSPALAFD